MNEDEPELVGSCADQRALANAEVVEDTDPVLGSLDADIAVGIALDAAPAASEEE